MASGVSVGVAGSFGKSSRVSVNLPCPPSFHFPPPSTTPITVFDDEEGVTVVFQRTPAICWDPDQSSYST